VKLRNDPVTISGEVYRLSVSASKGSKKDNVAEVSLIADFGIAGDAHAGSERQLSLLPYEAFDVVRERLPDIKPGDFAENITTRGIDFSSASVGDRLRVGDSVRLEITHIGKECHHDCHIRQAVGDCIMPRLGIFASVAEGGLIRVGDRIRWENGSV
jgi:MOSC domain-containing protein YiiM